MHIAIEVFKIVCQYLSSDTINILLFVFSDDWICVAPASDQNLKPIAAITEGEEDKNITASPSFKYYDIRYYHGFEMAHLQMSNDLIVVSQTKCSIYIRICSYWVRSNLEKLIINSISK